MKHFTTLFIAFVYCQLISLAASHFNYELGGKQCTGTLQLPKQAVKEFCVVVDVDLTLVQPDQEILSIEQVMEVKYRLHNPDDRSGQNYPAYKMPDGSVPVLEGKLRLTPFVPGGSGNTLTVGVPLAMLTNPMGNHQLMFVYNQVQFSLYVDGKLVDNDFVLGETDALNASSWRVNKKAVKHARICDTEQIQLPAHHEYTVKTVQYGTPPFFNAWVGDVVTTWFNGRYHLYYLFDRRGHGSKLGRGGHYFEHISTADFITWTVHEAAIPIDEQWETLGTGAPFVYNNKLYLTYGLHTTRIYPREQTTLPDMWKSIEQDGSTKTITFDAKKKDLWPAGSTYAVSEDGIHFKKSNVLFHPCENPTVYVNPDGKLRLLANYQARGTWASESLEGGWHCINKDFPTGGDCTFFFRIGAYDYIIGGFERMWYKGIDEPETSWRDASAEGKDFYCGLSVPAVTQIADGRWVTAGWVWHEGWGGPLAMEEVYQQPDGRLGTRWMKELIPETSTTIDLRDGMNVTNEQRFMLTFDVEPENIDGSVNVDLLPAEGEDNACNFHINLARQRAVYTDYSNKGNNERTIREGGSPSQAKNYAIEGGFTSNRPFTVRMVVLGNDKMGGTLLDTEINQERTMISNRKRLNVGRVSITGDRVKVKNIKLSPLKK